MAIILRRDKGIPLTHTEMDNNFDELDKIPNGKVFPSDPAVGIKVDINNPIWSWQDMLGELHADDSRYKIYRGNIKAIQFAEQEDAFCEFHMPHDYAMGTDLFIHIHWSHKSNVVTGGSVTWGFELMYGKRGGTFNDPIVVSVQQDAGNQYQHMVAEGIASTPGGSPVLLNTNDLEVDGIIQCRVFLDSNDITTSDSSVVDPFGHFVDIHYQSTGIGTKNKAPDFWA